MATTITIAIFYYFFLLVVLFFMLYSFFNIYHLIRFGFLSFANVLVVILYVALATFFIIFTFNQLATVDWNYILVDLSDTNPWSGL
jgi:hypothetical protein